MKRLFLGDSKEVISFEWERKKFIGPQQNITSSHFLLSRKRDLMMAYYINVSFYSNFASTPITLFSPFQFNFSLVCSRDFFFFIYVQLLEQSGFAHKMSSAEQKVITHISKIGNKKYLLSQFDPISVSGVWLQSKMSKIQLHPNKYFLLIFSKSIKQSQTHLKYFHQIRHPFWPLFRSNIFLNIRARSFIHLIPFHAISRRVHFMIDVASAISLFYKKMFTQEKNARAKKKIFSHCCSRLSCVPLLKHDHFLFSLSLSHSLNCTLPWPALHFKTSVKKFELHNRFCRDNIIITCTSHNLIEISLVAFTSDYLK